MAQLPKIEILRGLSPGRSPITLRSLLKHSSTRSYDIFCLQHPFFISLSIHPSTSDSVNIDYIGVLSHEADIKPRNTARPPKRLCTFQSTPVGPELATLKTSSYSPSPVNSLSPEIISESFLHLALLVGRNPKGLNHPYSSLPLHHKHANAIPVILRWKPGPHKKYHSLRSSVHYLPRVGIDHCDLDEGRGRWHRRAHCLLLDPGELSFARANN